MVAFSDAVAEGDFSRYVAVTAAQSGKTDTELDLIGHRLDQRPAPILYAGPSKEFVSDQFEPRLTALFEEAASLKAKIAPLKRPKKTLKIVAGVPIRLAHAGSSTALKSDPAALALVDEYDEMLANVRGQGDPLGLIEFRGITYSDFVTVVVSTPSTGVAETVVDPVSKLEFWKTGTEKEIESPIWRLFQQGTRHHWCWPCPHCDEFFVPRLKLLRWPKNATPAQAKRNTWIDCPNCGGEIRDHLHKKQMNAGGLLIAPGQTIVNGALLGVPADTSTFSMWVTGLASPFVTWGQRAEGLLDARVANEEPKIQTAINAGFGELHSIGSGADVPEWQEVMGRQQGYHIRTVPRGVLRIAAAVDVQARSLYFVIRGFGGGGTSWLLDYGVLLGNTAEQQVWDDLAVLLSDPLAGMLIERCFIDSGFRPNKVDSGNEHQVYKFCREHSWLCLPTKGRDVIRGIPFVQSKIEVKDTGERAPYSLELVTLNTDFFKQMVHARLRTPVDQTGAFYVPIEVTEDYARQLVSEVRITTMGKPQWLQRSHANHFFDCEAMVAACGYTLNVHRLPPGVERNWEPGQPQPGPLARFRRPGAPAPAPTREPEPVAAPVAAGVPLPPPGTDVKARFAGFGARMSRGGRK